MRRPKDGKKRERRSFWVAKEINGSRCVFRRVDSFGIRGLIKKDRQLKTRLSAFRPLQPHRFCLTGS